MLTLPRRYRPQSNKPASRPQLKLPLFTGCRNRVHVWQEGGYFAQSHIYSGFLLHFDGLAARRCRSLKCADIRTDGEFLHFDLRPFDARGGRVAQRTRDRILGHASDVRGRYGRKGILDPQIAARIEALEPQAKDAREILLAAKNRADCAELTVPKAY